PLVISRSCLYLDATPFAQGGPLRPMEEHNGAQLQLSRFPRKLQRSLTPFPELTPPNYWKAKSLPLFSQAHPITFLSACDDHSLSGTAGSHLVYQHIQHAAPFVLRAQKCQPLVQCAQLLSSALTKAVQPATNGMAAEQQNHVGPSSLQQIEGRRCEVEVEHEPPACADKQQTRQEARSVSTGQDQSRRDTQDGVTEDWWDSEEKEEEQSRSSAEVQPWARKRVDAPGGGLKQGPLQHERKDSAGFAKLVQSGQVESKQQLGQMESKQEGRGALLEVACVGGPFFRFLRTDPAKNTIAAAPGGGGGWYHVKQPEWRLLKLSGGLRELLECMAAWPSQRLMAEVPLATLAPLSLLERQAVARAATDAAFTAKTTTASTGEEAAADAGLTAVPHAAKTGPAPPAAAAGGNTGALPASKPAIPFPAALPWQLTMAPGGAAYFGSSSSARCCGYTPVCGPSERRPGPAKTVGVKVYAGLQQGPATVHNPPEQHLGSQGGKQHTAARVADRERGAADELQEALQHLCAWLPGALLMRPLPVWLAEAAAGAAAQGSEEARAAKEAAAAALTHSWCSGGSVTLRWWSAGSMEPLCAEPTDRLLVQ
ncbi:hypothetical protein DUNSADRAFT_14395, partial [Dunaliella salina]